MAVNMSYCRFTNTLAALRECNTALEDEGVESLTPEEKKAAQKLLKLCGNMFEDFNNEVA